MLARRRHVQRQTTILRFQPSLGHQLSIVLPMSAAPRSLGGATSIVKPSCGIGSSAPEEPASDGGSGVARGSNRSELPARKRQ